MTDDARINDEDAMGIALAEAEKALGHGDVPVGAVRSGGAVAGGGAASRAAPRADAGAEREEGIGGGEARPGGRSAQR